MGRELEPVARVWVRAARRELRQFFSVSLPRRRLMTTASIISLNGVINCLPTLRKPGDDRIAHRQRTSGAAVGRVSLVEIYVNRQVNRRGPQARRAVGSSEHASTRSHTRLKSLSACSSRRLALQTVLIAGALAQRGGHSALCRQRHYGVVATERRDGPRWPDPVRKRSAPPHRDCVQARLAASCHHPPDDTPHHAKGMARLA